MDRGAVHRYSEQAIIPFSVAHTSPSVGDEKPPVDSLYLSLEAGQRVRVLRRGYHHGTSSSHAAAHSSAFYDDQVSLSQSQWCIAQREDGTTGLVPGSLIRRIPGATFDPRRGAASVATHRDPLQDLLSNNITADHHCQIERKEQELISGAQQASPTQVTRSRRRSLWNSAADERNTEFDEHTNASDVQPLQEQRQSTFSVSSGTLGDVSSTPSRTEARSKGIVGDVTNSEMDERYRVLKEMSSIRSDSHWLSNDVVPRLQAACAAAQARLEQVRQDRHSAGTASSSCGTADTAHSHEAIDREHERLKRLLEEYRKLQAELSREVPADALSEPGTCPPSDGSNLPICDTRRESSASTTPDTHVVERLRLLVKEERKTVDVYQSQKEALERRRRRLAELMQEAHAEETSLRDSETALRELVGEEASEPAADLSWPRSLKGLTAEEDAALRGFLRVFDKYSRKLRLLTDDTPSPAPTSPMSHASDMSQSADSPTASSSSAAILGGLNITAGSTPPDKQSHPKDGAATSEQESTPATPTQLRVERLRQVLDKGNTELAQLQEKIKAAQTFCDTYGPIAREVEAQLQRGERILSEKKKYLEELQAS